MLKKAELYQYFNFDLMFLVFICILNFSKIHFTYKVNIIDVFHIVITHALDFSILIKMGQNENVFLSLFAIILPR